MRWFMGIFLIVVIFVVSGQLRGAGLIAYLNAEALVLVALSPLALAVTIYEWREITTYVRILFRAIVYREHVAQDELLTTFSQIGQALEQGRRFDAVHAIESANDEAVRTAGLLYLKQYSRERLHDVYAAKAQQTLARIRRAEDCFMTLARAAPAFGLIGTIKGFINLLAHIDDSSSLGVGMAMALTATLYGVALSYCLYHPLAKTIGAYANKRRQHFHDTEHAILLILDGRDSDDLSLLLQRPANGADLGGVEAA